MKPSTIDTAPVHATQNAEPKMAVLEWTVIATGEVKRTFNKVALDAAPALCDWLNAIRKEKTEYRVIPC